MIRRLRRILSRHYVSRSAHRAVVRELEAKIEELEEALDANGRAVADAVEKAEARGYLAGMREMWLHIHFGGSGRTLN